MPNSTLPITEGQHAGERQQADHVHHLDQRVDGRAGGVLQRIADRVAGDAGLVLLGALAGRRGLAARPRSSSWRCPRRRRRWP